MMKQFTFLLRTLCCGLFFLSNAAPVQAQITYVTPTGAGNASGSSWADAAPGTQLQDKINNAPSGSQVWVAAGIYKPTTGTDRNASFYLKNGIAMYGGFNGSESFLNRRNVSGNPTILSGDINAADDNGDNCYHILTSVNNDSTTVLDGFTIRDGNANGDDWIAVSGHRVFQSGGGGLLSENSSPHIVNCTFFSNTFIGKGC